MESTLEPGYVWPVEKNEGRFYGLSQNIGFDIDLAVKILAIEYPLMTQ